MTRIAVSAALMFLSTSAMAFDAGGSVGGVSAGASVDGGGVSAGSGSVSGGVSAGGVSAGGSVGSSGASVGGTSGGVGDTGTTSGATGGQASGGTASSGQSASSASAAGASPSGDEGASAGSGARPRSLVQALLGRRARVELPCSVGPCGGKGERIEGPRAKSAGPMRTKLGTPPKVLALCKKTAAASARRYGMTDISVTSRGAPVKRGDGLISAPVYMRIVYNRGGAYEMKEAPVSCVLDSNGAVAAIQDA